MGSPPPYQRGSRSMGRLGHGICSLRHFATVIDYRYLPAGCNEIIQTLIFCHIRSQPHLFDGRSEKA